MDSKPNETHTTTDDSSDEAAKQHFLDALLAAGEESNPSASDRESVESDEVALSSNPEEIDLPGAPVSSVSPRSKPEAASKKPEIMYSIERNSTPSDKNELVADESEESSLENEMESESDADLLLLSCPKCDGQLALREEHVGVQGACVWCQAPIVAGRTGSDRSVKVFAISTEGEEEKEFASPEPKAEEEKAPEESFAAEAASFDPPEEEAEAVAEESKPEQEAPPATSFQPAETPEPEPESGAIATGWGAPSPAVEESGKASDQPSEDFAPADSFDAEPANEFAPVEEEELPPSTGFGEAHAPIPETEEKQAQTFGGFSDSKSDDDEEEDSDDKYSGSGFGEFLSSASGKPKAAEATTEEKEQPSKQFDPEGFSSPTPWGPPTPQAEQAPQNTSAEPAPNFESPAAMNEAAPAENREQPKEEAPQDMAPANDFAAPMDWGSPAQEAPSEETEPAPSPSADAGNSAFGFPAETPEQSDEDAAPTAFSGEVSNAEPAPAPASTPDSLFSQDSSPQSESETCKEEMPVGFNIPSSNPSDSLFASLESTDAPPSNIGEEPAEPKPASGPPPIPENDQNEAPAPSAGPLFGSASSQAANSLFGPPADDPSPQTSSNPFGEEKRQEAPAPTAEEKSTEAAEPAQSAENETTEEKPKVETVKLGKEKKKRGKGFFIVAVIVLGMVCGAALASFVLPVDEYVNSARSLMEKKFMPSATWEAAQNSPAPQQSAAPQNGANN